jgi:hypothetical protein
MAEAAGGDDQPYPETEPEVTRQRDPR